MARNREHRKSEHRNRGKHVLLVMRLSMIALVMTVPLLHAPLDALHSDTRLTIVTILWLVWAGLLLCVFVPASSALTTLRLLAPSHTAVILIVAAHTFVQNTDVVIWPTMIAFALSVVATISALSGDTGRYYIQVSAYGDEHRFLLACPVQMIAVQVLTWSAWFTLGTVSVVALTGDSSSPGRLIIGGVCVVLTVLGLVILPRRFHRFSRRWLVWVPAGIVVHDDVILAETAMVSRRSIRAVQLWQPGDEPEPLNLTGDRLQSGIVIALRELETIILSASTDHPGGHALHVQSFLVRPTRLQPALAEITDRLSNR